MRLSGTGNRASSGPAFAVAPPGGNFRLGNEIQRRSDYYLACSDDEFPIFLVKIESIAMSHETRLSEIGLSLPNAPNPGGLYTPAVRSGNLLYLAGHVPTTVRGKVGQEISEQEAAEAAAEVGHLVLATMRDHLGTLDRVERIVKVFGLVNCTPDFTNISQVINGFSQVMIDVFGEAGRAARSAVGAGSLPFAVPVEVEVIVEIRD